MPMVGAGATAPVLCPMALRIVTPVAASPARNVRRSSCWTIMLLQFAKEVNLQGKRLNVSALRVSSASLLLHSRSWLQLSKSFSIRDCSQLSRQVGNLLDQSYWFCS